MLVEYSKQLKTLLKIPLCWLIVIFHKYKIKNVIYVEDRLCEIDLNQKYVYFANHIRSPWARNKLLMSILDAGSDSILLFKYLKVSSPDLKLVRFGFKSLTLNSISELLHKNEKTSRLRNILTFISILHLEYFFLNIPSIRIWVNGSKCSKAISFIDNIKKVNNSFLIFPQGQHYDQDVDLTLTNFLPDFIKCAILKKYPIISIYQEFDEHGKTLNIIKGYPSSPIENGNSLIKLTEYYKDLLIELQNEAHGNKDYYHELLKNLQIKAENYSTIDSTI